MGRLMNEFDDDGDNGGGDIDDALDDSLDDDSDLDEGYDSDKDDSSAERPAGFRKVTPPVAPVDAAAIARAVAEGIRPMLPSQNQQPQQMSEEEFRKATDYFSVNPEMAKQFATLLGLEVDDDRTGKLAGLLQSIVDGTARHALKTAGLMQGVLKEELASRVTGIETRHQQQATEKFLESVQTRYPALKAHRDILPDVLNQIKASGAKPKNAEEAAKLVAKAARDHIRKFIPDFMNSNSPKARRMAGSFTGGGASTGGFGAGGQKKTKAASLPWD